MKQYFLSFALLSFCGCVPLPEGTLAGIPSLSDQTTEAPYTGLEPGYKTVESAHFLVKAYTSETATAFSKTCEASYNRVMGDVGLYSFAPAKPYNIVVYKNADEYRKKTGQPNWSGGISYGNAILVYESEKAPAVLAHEMTHLIFNEFMGPANTPDKRWINEGLAVFEETRTDISSSVVYNQRVHDLVKPNPIPFSQMINLIPIGEQDVMVERWYAQVYSVISLMISRGGALGFSIFIAKLKDGLSLDVAAADAFPNLWKNPGDLEKDWLERI